MQYSFKSLSFHLIILIPCQDLCPLNH
ncbi:hypothetical protein F383_24844 [Gossypium arboreum]|uniref:Uncharacterized protein n=1 Tax=Gossypium arboreum TaxID=29729 RepID=A0A0B0MLD6_GOSAR|nr:hypothetical protein F383_24844 [Gossypium arboreum]